MDSKNELGLTPAPGCPNGSSDPLPSSTRDAGRALFLNGGRISGRLSCNADPIYIVGELHRCCVEELSLSRKGRRKHTMGARRSGIRPTGGSYLREYWADS